MDIPNRTDNNRLVRLIAEFGCERVDEKSIVVNN